MKIVLINPPSSTDPSQKSIPLNIMIIKSILDEYYEDVEIIDYDFMIKKGEFSKNDFIKQAIVQIEEIKPDLVGFTTNCSNYPIAIELALNITEKLDKVRVFLGGPQASFAYKRTLERFLYINFIVVGEGEKTIRELAERNFILSSDIRGISYRHNNEIVFTGERDLLTDFGGNKSIYETVDIKSYWEYISRQEVPMIPIEVGRGCPMNCTFCCTSIFWKRKYRNKPIEKIVDEIVYLKDKYGIDSFSFVHDNLTFSSNYVIQLCDEILKKKLDIKWICSSRIDHLEASLVDLMKNSGCRGVFFGIESGSEEIQKSINKRIDVESVITTIKMVAEFGMYTTASFILGFPGEKIDQLEKTLLLALECRRAGAYIEIQTLSPMLGTDIYNTYKDSCIFSENYYQRLWLDYSDLRIHKIIEEDIEIFNFFHSFENYGDFNYIELYNIYSLFVLVINNDAEALYAYYKKNTGVLKLYREIMGENKLSAITKVKDKAKFFSDMYKLYIKIRPVLYDSIERGGNPCA